MATQYTAGLTTGQVLTAATMNSIGAAWETWTPQLFTGTGQANTSTATGVYAKINKIAIVHVYLNASGAGGTGVLECRNIPSAIRPKRTGGLNNSSGAEIGSGGYLDAGTAYYIGQVYPTSTTAFRLVVAGSTDLALTAGSGDKFTFTITYEIA